jgi:hypothetical protein
MVPWIPFYCSFLTGRIDQSKEILKHTEDNEKFTTGDGQTNVTYLATYGGTMSTDGAQDPNDGPLECLGLGYLLVHPVECTVVGQHNETAL